MAKIVGPPDASSYVINQDGVIAYAEVNADHTRRPEPGHLPVPISFATGKLLIATFSSSEPDRCLRGPVIVINQMDHRFGLFIARAPRKTKSASSPIKISIILIPQKAAQAERKRLACSAR